MYYSVKDAVDLYSKQCIGKVSMPAGQLFGKSILAGMMIGMGAAAGNVASHNIGNVGLARLAAAVVFPVGLMMVILLGAELFTGDCLAAMAVSDRRITAGQLIKLLFCVFFGNLVGATMLSILIAACGQLDYSNGLLGAYTIKVALGKAGIAPGKAFISGICCNILVCAAVIMAVCAKDVTGKLLCSFFVIMLFVTAGFEHCVANMYYITAGLLAKLNPAYMTAAMQEYGLTRAQLDVLNIRNYVIGNLIPVTAGNIVGGIFFIGLPLHHLNLGRRPKEVIEKGENMI